MARHHLTHAEEVKGGKDSHHKHEKKTAHKAKVARHGHESKKTAKHHEHMGMEKHLRGPVKKKHHSKHHEK